MLHFYLYTHRETLTIFSATIELVLYKRMLLLMYINKICALQVLHSLFTVIHYFHILPDYCASAPLGTYCMLLMLLSSYCQLLNHYCQYLLNLNLKTKSLQSDSLFTELSSVLYSGWTPTCPPADQTSPQDCMGMCGYVYRLCLIDVCDT